MRGSRVAEHAALKGSMTMKTARQIFSSDKKLIGTLKSSSITQLKPVRVDLLRHLQSYEPKKEENLTSK